jgi:hypothetical protein
VADLSGLIPTPFRSDQSIMEELLCQEVVVDEVVAVEQQDAAWHAEWQE